MSLLFICIISVNHIKAQGFDDAELRQKLALSYSVNKDLSFEAKYFLQLDNGMTHFKQNLFGIEASYKIFSWIKAGVEYRFETNHYDDLNIMRYYISLDYDINKKWKLKYRPIFQQEFGYLNSEYIAAHPNDYLLRNMLMIEYEYSKHTTIYLFTERYNQFEKSTVAFNKQKTGIGIEYVYKKRHSFSFELDWIRKTENENIGRIDVSYCYELGYVKKKKNKETSNPKSKAPNQTTQKKSK